MGKADLEKENKRLKEELFALNRNFEALCQKLKEEKNLIKRLEDELSHSKNKIVKDDLVNEIQNYKEKYEQLANSVSLIETKYHNASQNCKRYQENELKYKAYIQKLEEKAKSKDKLESQNYQMRRQHEQESSFLLEENKKLEKENNRLLAQIEETNKKAQETNDTYEQMKKENELIYKLLEETREKLKNNNQIIAELSNQMKNKKDNTDDSKYKQLYNDILKGYNNLKEQYDCLINRNNIKEISPQIYFSITSSSKEHSNDIVRELLLQFKDSFFVNYEKRINDKLHLLETKIESFSGDTINKINNISSKGKASTMNNNEIDELHNKILKLQLEISSLNATIKKKDSKIEKTKIKKRNYKKEVESLTHNINIMIQNKQNYVDISEIKALFNQLNEIFERLKLTMETFQINLNCKHCFEIKNKLIQLSCGHSLCEDCFKVENSCIECEKVINKQTSQDNLFTNNVIARYNYAKQQIESDINFVITTLNDYFITHKPSSS